MIVAAVGRNGAIGIEGGLPWRIPEDLARFKQLTMGHAVVMGRATYESIGRPLPGRRNIVLSRSVDLKYEGVEVAGSLHGAIETARSHGEHAFIIGGAEVYRTALPVADRMELTEVDSEPKADTWFPDVDWSNWQEVARERHSGFSFVTYTRA